MALPQQVIDRLSKEPPKTPGWSLGILTFSAGVFAIVLVVYFGLTLGYEPYLNSQVAQVNAKMDTLSKAISADDQTKFVSFYSQIVNVQAVLVNHVTFSQFFAWLEKNTEANIYFSHVGFTAPNQVSLTGFAKSEDDINQQLAIFEAAPDLKSAVISSAGFSAAGGLWQFSAILILNPTLIHGSSS